MVLSVAGAPDCEGWRAEIAHEPGGRWCSSSVTAATWLATCGGTGSGTTIGTRLVLDPVDQALSQHPQRPHPVKIRRAQFLVSGQFAAVASTRVFASPIPLRMDWANTNRFAKSPLAS